MPNITKIMASIDRLKRNLANNVQNDLGGAIGLGVQRMREDFQADPVNTVLNASNFGGVGGGLLGTIAKSQKLTPRLAELEEAYQAGRRAGLPEGHTPMDRAKLMGYEDMPVDYRMEHQAPTRDVDDYNAPLFKMDSVYPDDIYSNKARQYYGDGFPTADAQSLAKINLSRSQPEKMVTVFRAVPNEVKANTLNNGDWVTLSESYAKQHGERFDGGYKIIEERVPAKTLYSDGNSINEFGFDRSQEFADGAASIPSMRNNQGLPERSRFAAFNPEKSSSRDLLASFLAASPGLSLLNYEND